MRPFQSIAAVNDWWHQIALQQGRFSCSVLVDFTDIGLGVQRRTIYQTKAHHWVIGFARDRG